MFFSFDSFDGRRSEFFSLVFALVAAMFWTGEAGQMDRWSAIHRVVYTSDAEFAPLVR